MPTPSQTQSTPHTGKQSRRIKPNPNYPPLSAHVATQEYRDRIASASQSPSSTPTPKQKSKPPTDSGDDERREAWEERLVLLEARVVAIEEERKSLREEVWRLRDRLEESEFARGQLEERMKKYEQWEEKTEEIRKEVKKETEERRKREKEIMEVEKEERQKEIKEVEERVTRQLGGSVGAETAAPECHQRPEEEQRHRCLILTDSNGRDVTADSVRNHIPREQRANYDINIEVIYRVEDAIHRLAQGALDVIGHVVVVDNITNNVRGGWRHPPDTPAQLIQRIDALRQKLLSLGAAAVVVAEIKPMSIIDVRPYNRALHEYLNNCGPTGFGCKTQIRMEYLRSDGYHVNPLYDSVVDRTYACALLGRHVPCPTPDDNFVPTYIRRRWEQEWPRLVGQGWGVGP